MEIDGTKRQSFIVGVWGVEPDGVIWARPLMIWEIIIDTLKTSLPGRRAFMSLLPFPPPPPRLPLETCLHPPPSSLSYAIITGGSQRPLG